jgi:succinyl-diaminopimelate desuccinylase
MTDKTVFNRVLKRIDTYEDDMIEMQMRLTAIPAISPENGGDGEYRKTQYLLSCLRKMKCADITEINAEDTRVSSGIRPNVIAVIPGKSSAITVWILTHTDVVPPGELGLWHTDPFTCCIKEGRIYGRGTEDNHQDMIASLFAVKALLDEGIEPESTIGLSFVADEETASRFGVSHVLRSRENPFRKTDIIVVPDSGNEEGTLIEIAEKSVCWLGFRTIGQQCHASRPSSGKNAFQAASHLVVLLNDLHDVFGASDPFYQPQTSTFQPTKKDANVPNINTIPGEDVFYLDSRVLPRYRITDVMSEIRKMADEIEKKFAVRIEITTIQGAQAPPPTPHDAPVVFALQEAIREVYHVHATPQGIGAGTVAAAFRHDGYPAAVWSKINHTAHQPNENCLIANMLGNAKVYAHLFMQKHDR